MEVKSVAMTPEMIEQIQTLADTERRTFSQTTRILIETGLGSVTRTLKAALERADPYPVFPECPADTDQEV